MRRFRVLSVFLVATLGGATASADESPWQLETSASTRVWDNFFQANDDSDAVAVTAGAVQLRVSHESPSTGMSWYLRGASIHYDEFDDMGTELGVGLGYGARGTSASVNLGLYWDRPRFDVGESFDRATGLDVMTRFGQRLGRDWEVVGSLGYIIEKQKAKDELDNTGHDLSAGLRYRGFGGIFSPEVGAHWGSRSVDSVNSSYDQTAYYLKLRSAPTPWLYLSARYRLRQREYTVAEMTASNFGREDTRRQLTLLGSVKTGKHLTWTIYYALEDSESTRLEREFRSQFAELTLSLRL